MGGRRLTVPGARHRRRRPGRSRRAGGAQGRRRRGRARGPAGHVLGRAGREDPPARGPADAARGQARDRDAHDHGDAQEGQGPGPRRQGDGGRRSSGSARAAATMFVRSNPFSAMWEGLAWSTDVTVKTAIGLYKIVVGQLDRSNIGGPIQIAKTAGEQARQGIVEPRALHRGDQRQPVPAQPLAGADARRRPPALLRLRGGAGPAALGAQARGRPAGRASSLLMLLMVYAFYNDSHGIDGSDSS